MSKEHESDLYERYLHDYVACVHTSMQDDPRTECKVNINIYSKVCQSGFMNSFISVTAAI